MSCQRILWEELRSFTALGCWMRVRRWFTSSIFGWKLSDLFWLKVSIFHRLLHSQLLPSYRHAAGIIDFVDLKSQTAERMGKVFKPKAGSDVFVKGGIRTEIKIIIWDHGFWWILFWYLEEWFFSTTKKIYLFRNFTPNPELTKKWPLAGCPKEKGPSCDFHHQQPQKPTGGRCMAFAWSYQGRRGPRF